MSSIGTSELPSSISTGPKSKKNKKKKAKAKSNGETVKPSGSKADENNDNEDGDEEGQEIPRASEPNSPTKVDVDDKTEPVNGAEKTPRDPTLDPISQTISEATNGLQKQKPQSKRSSLVAHPVAPDRTQVSSAEDDAELDTMAKEREALQDEVAQVRRSLEEMQARHEEEMSSIREQLSQTETRREQAETQYQSLLGKVNTIRSQLGERLKADAEDLSQARNKIEDLEEQNANLHEQNEAHAGELSAMAEDGEQRSKELSTLRNRTTLSQQNWAKEREDLIQRENLAKEEFEAARQAMQDWEVLAMEERSIRENIAEKVADLEEQVSSHREAHERAAAERDNQSVTVDGLQRALQDIQNARRQELREIVENSQTQVETLQKQLRVIETKANESSTALESTKTELERALPFEKEVKEKNLLIGKLRHEAVILNDHLTKALKYLKRGKPQDTIDKQLVTNHFMHFLALERTDPKKFQVLQIIANLLEWTDGKSPSVVLSPRVQLLTFAEQREQAGLARPGGSNPNSRIPISPWHRTPSTPALSTDFFPGSSARKESLAELWSGFLEQEAQAKTPGVQSPPSSSGGPGGQSPPSSSGGSKPP